MKKISKICINSSIFISSNVLVLMLYGEKSNATPRSFGKPSTVRLLSEVITSPASAFISKLPNGNLKASFLHTGQKIGAVHIFPVKSSTLVEVKKTHTSEFTQINPTKSRMIINSEGVDFKLSTYSKLGLIKEIVFSTENGNMTVTSTKGNGTSHHVFKKTILNFGDGASTSTQTSSLSPEPKITVTRYSLPNKKTKEFDVEKTSIYNPLNSKLISQLEINRSTGYKKSIVRHADSTLTELIEHPDGRTDTYLKNSLGEILTSTVMDTERNVTITRKVNHDTYLKNKYNSNKILLETTLSTSTKSETKTYNENGSLTSTSIMNTFSGGETLETITSSSSTITYERRNDGSLKTIITTTSDGQVLKQDFDVNNTPLNAPYRIN